MKSRKIIFIMATILLMLSGCTFNIYTRSDNGLDGSPMLIKAPDGTIYKNISAYGFKYEELGKRIGDIGWGPNIFGSGVYEVNDDDDGRNSIVIKEFLSDFDMIFCKDNIDIPELEEKNFNGIRWVDDNNTAIIRDSEVINLFLEDLKSDGKELDYDTLEIVSEIYLYPNSLPGLICPINIYYFEGLYLCESPKSFGFVNIDEKIINTLKKGI